MTTPTSGSISLTGLLGGTAGQIDTTALITSLMTAASVPQSQLKDQLTAEQTLISAYQAVNTKMSALQTAAQTFTDPLSTIWQSTAAASSSTSVVATSNSQAVNGATTFNVLALAAAQISTIAADSSGNVVSNPANGITITGSDNVPHTIALTSGSASDVASAINAAGVGVRASVLSVDDGSGGTTTVLQLASTATGTQAAFTTDAGEKTVVAAANAKIGVGDPANGGYTVSSQSNTFTGVIPGVTFTVSALENNVSIGVRSDIPTIADAVGAMVTALNDAAGTIGQTTAQGAVLQGSYDVTSLQQTLYGAISNGVNGASLHTYGIDMDSTGNVTFDSGAFTTAFMNDPTGTQNVIKSFANALNSTATAAVDPTSGTITSALTAANTQTTNLNTQINNWTDRLADIKASMTAKYNAMSTMLAKLQSQSTYLTSMLKSMDSSSSSSSSS